MLSFVFKTVKYYVWQFCHTWQLYKEEDARRVTAPVLVDKRRKNYCRRGIYHEYGIVQNTGWSLETNTKIQPNSQTH